MNSASAVVVVVLFASAWGKPQPEAEPQQDFGAGRGGRRLFDDVPQSTFNRGPPAPNSFAGGFDDDLDFNQGFSGRQVGNQRFNEPLPFDERPEDNFNLGPLDFDDRQQHFNENQQGKFEQDFSNQPSQFGFNNQQGFDRNHGFSQSDIDVNQQDTFDNAGFGIEQDFSQVRRDFVIKQDAIIPEPSGFGNQQVPFGQGEPSFGDPLENFVATPQRNRFPQENRIQQEILAPQTNQVPQTIRIPQRSISPQRSIDPQTKRVPQTNRETQTNRVPQTNRLPQINRVPQTNGVQPPSRISQNNRSPQESRIPQGTRNQPRNRVPQTNINQQEFFVQDRENIGSEQERFGSQQNTQREVTQRISDQERDIRTGQRFGNQQEIIGQEQQRFAPVTGNTQTRQQIQRNQQPITPQRQTVFPSQQDFIEDVRSSGFQQNDIIPQQTALNRGQESATLINGQEQQRFAPVTGNTHTRQQKQRNQQPITPQRQQVFPSQQDFIEDVRSGGFQQNDIRPQQAALNRGQEGATLINGGLKDQDRRQTGPNNSQLNPDEDLQIFPDQQSFLGPQSGDARQPSFSGNQQSFGSSRTGPGTSQQGFGSQQGSNSGEEQAGRREQPGSGGIRTRQQNFNGTQEFSDGSISRQQQNIGIRQEFNGNERRTNNRRQPDFNNHQNNFDTSQQNFNEQGGFRTSQQGISSRQQDFNSKQPVLPQGEPDFNTRSSFIRPEENSEQEPFRPVSNQPRNNAPRREPIGPRQTISENNQVANSINRFPISQSGNGQQSFDNRQQSFGGSQQSFSGQRGFGRSRQGTNGSEQGFGSQQNLSN